MHSPPRSLPMGLLLAFALAPRGLTQVPFKEAAAAPRKLVPVHLREQGQELARYRRVHLAVPDEPLAFETLELDLEGQWVTLDLQRRSNRSELFEVLAQREDGSYERIQPEDPTTFRGRARELKGAEVAGSFLPTGMEARIFLEDGRTLGIEPDFAAFARGDRQSFLVYDLRDVIGGEWHCDGEAFVPAASDQRRDLAVGCTSPLCRAELALDLDFGFFQQYGGETLAATAVAESIVNVVNVVYEREARIHHEITTIILRTSLASEPPGYATSNNAADFLAAMRFWWLANHANIARDIAHGITGRHSGGDAYLYSEGDGVICDPSFGFGVSGSALDPYLRCVSNVVAHELGHNWGATHCACANPDYIMNPFYPPCPLRHHPTESIPDILSEKASVSCLNASIVGDDFEHPLVMSPGTLVGSTSGATNDGGSSCGSTSNAPDVWFRYRPMTSGAMTVSTCGSQTNYDTVLTLYGWNGSTFSELTCNDDSCGFSSRIDYDVVGDLSYYIRVSGFSGTSGTFELQLQGPSDRPINDHWQDAIDIGASIQTGNTTKADRDPVSDGCGSTLDAPDVWYRYRPIADSWATVDLCQSSYDTMLAIFDVTSGAAPDASNLIGCNDDWCTRGSRVEWMPISGHDYLIRVSGFNGARGAFSLGLSGPDPMDDTCSGARLVTADDYWISMASATQVDGGATCGPTVPKPDRWFAFRAPSAGTVTARTCGTNDIDIVDRGVDTVISWHRGCPSSGGHQIACNDDSNSCTQLGFPFDSLASTTIGANETLYLRLSPFIAHLGDLVHLRFDFHPANDDCAFPVEVGEGTYTDSMLGATPDGQTYCVGSQGPDLWFHYTAPVSGRLTISTCGTNDLPGVDLGLDTALSVYSDCPGSGAITIACSDDADACTSAQGARLDAAVSFTIFEGRSVWIRVARVGGGGDGQFLLNLDLVPNGAKLPR